MWEQVIPAAASVLGKALGGGAPNSKADAAGGYSSAMFDHSNWTVQMGAGNVASPAGLLAMLGVGAALLWLTKKS